MERHDPLAAVGGLTRHTGGCGFLGEECRGCNLGRCPFLRCRSPARVHNWPWFGSQLFMLRLLW